jgi:hypothetical protein
MAGANRATSAASTGSEIATPRVVLEKHIYKGVSLQSPRGAVNTPVIPR